MATNTPNLNLLKKDPATDGNETFNIQTMLNDNWDKIDTAVGEIDIPDASLAVKGKVQLSSATDSDIEDKAVTPKAVKTVYDLANSAQNVATAAQTTANTANLAAATAQAKADSAETPAGAQTKVNNAVGQLSNLLTTNKTNTVSAINELFTNVSNGKNAVAAAITGKGVVASGSDTFEQFTSKIGQIITHHVMAPGEVLLYKDSGGHILTQSSSYEKTFVINVGMEGTFRIRFKMKSTDNVTAYARIYKKGVPYGTEHFTSATSYFLTFTEDLAFLAGDTIELWTKNGGGGYSEYFSPEVYGDMGQYIYP